MLCLVCRLCQPFVLFRGGGGVKDVQPETPSSSNMKCSNYDTTSSKPNIGWYEDTTRCCRRPSSYSDCIGGGVEKNHPSCGHDT